MPSPLKHYEYCSSSSKSTFSTKNFISDHKNTCNQFFAPFPKNWYTCTNFSGRVQKIGECLKEGWACLFLIFLGLFWIKKHIWERFDPNPIGLWQRFCPSPWTTEISWANADHRTAVFDDDDCLIGSVSRTVLLCRAESRGKTEDPTETRHYYIITRHHAITSKTPWILFFIIEKHFLLKKLYFRSQ